MDFNTFYSTLCNVPDHIGTAKETITMLEGAQDSAVMTQVKEIWGCGVQHAKANIDKKRSRNARNALTT